MLCCLQVAGVQAMSADTESDPWEGVNRGIFAFNEGLDRFVILPLAKGYRLVLPDPVQRGVGNFFLNLAELPAILNDLLQWRVNQAMNDGGRFVINTTIGVLGIFDMASEMGLEKNYQDFGVTLGRWGMEPGPYMVLPVLGPSTLRDTIGWVPDIYLHPFQLMEDDRHRYFLTVLDMVNRRADRIEVDELITGDRYVFFREAWLQQRQYIVTGEMAEDDFGDEDF